MSTGRTPLWMSAAALGALSLAVATFVRAHAAPAPWYYLAHDQQVYLAIARAPFSNDPMVHHGSASWRLLPPLMARYIGVPLGGPERGFLALTFATFALLPAACLLWLRSLGISRTSARYVEIAIALGSAAAAAAALARRPGPGPRAA
jgi:hypothetical protein